MIQALVAAVALSGCTGGGHGPAFADGKPFVETFDAAQELPPGWRVAHPQWSIEGIEAAPSPPQVLAGVSLGTEDALIVADGRRNYGDFELAVKIDLCPDGAAGIVVHLVQDDTFELFELLRSGENRSYRWVEHFGEEENVLSEGDLDPLPCQGWEDARVTSKGTGRWLQWGNSTWEVEASRLSVGRMGLWVGGVEPVRFDDVAVTAVD